MEKRNSDETKRVYEQRKPPAKPLKKGKPGYKPPPAQKEAKPEGGSERTEGRCQYCGYFHADSRRKCPASGRQCKKCNRKGHFAKVCHSKGPQKGQQHHTHQVTADEAEAEGSSDTEYTFSITGGKSRPMVKVAVNGVKGRMDAD